MLSFYVLEHNLESEEQKEEDKAEQEEKEYSKTLWHS